MTVLANSATSLVNPLGLAVDLLGNLFIDDNGGGTVDEFSAGSLPGAPLVTLESLGVNSPSGVAVDGGGNLFFGNAGVNEVEEFPAGTVPLAPYTTVANAASGQSSEAAVAVDSSGDVYIADWKAGQVEELPHAFVDQTPRAELATAGSDSLPAVLSAIANFTGPLANLTGPFAPTTDAGSSAWLSITGVSGGVVTYAFTANPGATRTGYITVLGLTIPVTQGGTTLSAAAYTVYRPEGLAAHIFWSNVQTNWSDEPGAAITLSPFNPVSGNGVALLENGSQILYPASAPNVNDEINYTITDNYGQTVSGVITVVVNPFPQTGQLSGALTIGGGRATVSFYGIIGQTYEIQRSTDLVNWVTVDTATVDSSGKITFTDTFPDLGSPPASAYYRLAWQP